MNSHADARDSRDARDVGSIPVSWRSPEKEIATHSSILAWKFHVQRSLAGYSSWDCEESDTTEHTHITLCYVTLRYICISLLRLGKRTLNLDSVNPFFLPTAWVTDVAAVKLWSCRWIQWLDRQRTTVCKGAASLNDFMEQNSHSSQQWRDYNMSSKLRQLLPKWALSLSEFFLPAFLPSEWCSKHNSEHAW